MKRTLFKKNADMSYVVHIVKMNNFNLQPPPLSSIFFLFFWGEGDSVNRLPSSHPQQNYCLATMQEQQFIDVTQKLSKWRTS